MVMLTPGSSTLTLRPAGSTVDDHDARRHQMSDVNAVLLGTDVRQRWIPGGLDIVVTATGRAVDAARRVVGAHARELACIPGLSARATPLPGGVRLTVTGPTSDGREATRIRGLGFVGLIAVGAHRQAQRQESAQPAA